MKLLNTSHKQYFDFILGGFMNDGFLARYNGSYMIEIFSSSNAVGIPVQNKKYELVWTNVKELFNVDSMGSFQNNIVLYVSYNSNYWGNQLSKSNGKVYCNLISILKVRYMFCNEM